MEIPERVGVLSALMVPEGTVPNNCIEIPFPRWPVSSDFGSDRRTHNPCIRRRSRRVRSFLRQRNKISAGLQHADFVFPCEPAEPPAAELRRRSYHSRDCRAASWPILAFQPATERKVPSAWGASRFDREIGWRLRLRSIGSGSLFLPLAQYNFPAICQIRLSGSTFGFLDPERW